MAKKMKVEDAEKNSGFLQLYKGGLPVFNELIKRSPTAAVVLTTVACTMDRKNLLVYQPKKLMVASEVWAESSFFEAIKLLIEKGFIRREKVAGIRCIRVNPAFFWQSGSSGKPDFGGVADDDGEPQPANWEIRIKAAKRPERVSLTAIR